MPYRAEFARLEVCPLSPLKRDRLNHEEDDGDDVGEQRTTGHRHHDRRRCPCQALGGDVYGVGPDQSGGDELEVGDEAGCKVHGAEVSFLPWESPARRPESERPLVAVQVAEGNDETG